MKTMMKRCGVFAVFAAVLAVTAAVILSCPTPESSGGKDEYQPPKGMGAVKLSFNNTTRTTRSIVPGTTLASFLTFDIDFTAVSGGALSDASNTDIPAANVAGPYNLYPGIYNIKVIGYTAEGDAAAGTLSNVNIVANTLTTPTTIYLEAYDPTNALTEAGKFVWNISNNVTGTLTSATMTFTVITGTVTAGGEPAAVNLLTSGNWVNSIDDFPAGYYYVDFVLTKSGAPAPMTLRHILHIYQNMTSSFSYTFSDLYFTYAQAELDIDFTGLVDPQPELEVDDGGGAVPLDEGDPVILSIDGVGAIPKSVTITVTNLSDYGTSDIEWFFNSTTALTGTMLTGTQDSVLTVNTANAPFNRQGTYHLTVIGSSDSDNIPGSTIVYIKIGP